MHLQSLEFTNLRVFKKAALAFPAVEAGRLFSNIHLFLGTNGSGKTTLLRAIAMAAIGPVLSSSGMRPYSLVRRAGAKGRPSGCTIEADFALGAQDGGTSLRSRTTLKAMAGYNDRIDTAQFQRGNEKPLWDEESAAYLVLGYGASRMPEPEGSFASSQDRSRLLRYRRVAGLFEEYVPLKALRNWLPSYRNQGRHSQVVTLINQLLADVEVALKPLPVDGEYLFEVNGSRLPLSALSDGYRAYIGWISDLLYHLCQGCPPGKMLRDSQGIVLIDEIDLHLHPQWQRVVIERLSATLPNLQFFVTSHSPLIAGSLPSANIQVVQGSQRDTTVQPVALDVYGWSADQILASPLFAQTPPRNRQAMQEIQATAVRARSGDHRAALRLMSVLADGVQPGAAATPAAPRRRSGA